MSKSQASVPVQALLEGMRVDAQRMVDDRFARANDINIAMQLGAGYRTGPLPEPAGAASASAKPASGIAALGKDGIGVLGAGQMATGIAECIARAGIPVTVLTRSDASAQRLHGSLNRSLDRSVAKGRIDHETANAACDRVVTTQDLGDLAAVDLVVEAIAEDLEVKREILSKASPVLGAQAVIATNTSSFRVAEIGDVLPHPVIALHFFNPAPAMKLMEIVTPGETEQYLPSARALAANLGKVPVTCGDARGFIVNRLLIPFLNDAVAVVESGSEPSAVDAAVCQEAGHPMGPLALIDLIGVDITIAALASMAEASSDARLTPRPLLRRMAEAGALGRKSGHGFFDYASH